MKIKTRNLNFLIQRDTKIKNEVFLLIRFPCVFFNTSPKSTEKSDRLSFRIFLLLLLLPEGFITLFT